MVCSEKKEVFLTAESSLPSVLPEDGSSALNATPITGNGTYTGEAPLPGPQIDAWNTTMYYKVELIVGEHVKLNLTGDAGTDFDLFVYNSTLDFVIESMTELYPEVVSFDVNITDTYYIIIAEYYLSDPGNYSLTVEILEGPNGDSFANAIPITEGIYIGASPLPGPFYDDIVLWNSSIFYVFWIEEGNQYQISLTGDVGTDFDLGLFDGMSDLDEIDYSVNIDYPDYMEGISSSSQYLYIVVAKYNEAEHGAYELTLNIETIIEGDSFEHAIPIVEGIYTGSSPLPGPSYDNELWNSSIYYVFWIEEGNQ
ncbi:MAG: hypothetical protein KAR35_02635, partial [Candidatus Heimdallarchaeota archaeon]|nr:hypothetical protein [Candidatus Heimdallarchaeota archaeon]MCK5048251.1 hypothetical protein [Candidatus Heimdallarchaeota archaeon]